MGKAEPELVAALGLQGDDKGSQLKQLKLLLVQLKESRDNSEQQLENLRSELAILRKQHQEQQQEQHQQQQPPEESGTYEKESEEKEIKHETLKKEKESLELEFNDAKKEILRLERENADLRHANEMAAASIAAATTVAPSEESDMEHMEITEDLSVEVKKELRRMKKKINKAVRQVETLKKKKIALDHQLEVSRFRENEAVAFLRLFRSYYYMIIRNNVIRGSGGYVANRITVAQSGSNTPAAAAGEKELVNIDKLMVESGLLEADEVGKVVKTDQGSCQGPTKVAFGKSNIAAEIARRNAMAKAVITPATVRAVLPTPPVTPARRLSHNIGKGGMDVPSDPSYGTPLSAVDPPESAKLISARQKLEETPAGRCIVMREKHLEEEVTKLSDKLVDIEKQLEEERRKNNAGSDTTLVEEANVLRKMLDSKENDLRIIVGKLRESCIVNWKLEESTKQLKEHILYLEDRLKNWESRSVPYGESRRKRRAAYRTTTAETTFEDITGSGDVKKKFSARQEGAEVMEGAESTTGKNSISLATGSIKEGYEGVHDEASSMDNTSQRHYEMSDMSGRSSVYSMMDSSYSKRFPTRVAAREMRFVQPSPAEEWKRRKQAERNKCGAQSVAASRIEEEDETSDDGKAPWMRSDKKPVASNTPPWMRRLRGDKGGPEKKTKDAEGEVGGIPEFMRKFKKIGAKNANEVIITYDGPQPGDNKKEQDEPPALVPAPCAPSPPPSPIPPEEQADPEPSPSPQPEPEKEPEPQLAEPPAPASDPSPPPTPAPAPEQEPTRSCSSFLDSDSDDSSNSSKKAPTKAPAAPPTPTPAPEQEPARSRSSFLDSDSDDSSDSSKKVAAKIPAAPPPKQASVDSSSQSSKPVRKSFLDSSSSDESS